MATQRLPEWFKQSPRKSRATKALSAVLEREVPNTICQEARCPNRGGMLCQRGFDVFDFGNGVYAELRVLQRTAWKADAARSK